MFDLSQWRIPESQRVISDNELYQVAGERIVNGADLFSITPEVPPAAKYLYGWSIKLTNNPYWVSIILYLATLVVFLLLARLILPSHRALLATLYLAVSPLYFSQATQSMLDLPQLFFFLIHIYFILRIFKNQSANTIQPMIWSLVAGITLGLFAACKIPLFLPIILLIDGWVLWKKQQLKLIIPILIGTVGTYALTYLAYFQQGHSLIDWLKTQKWMLLFYQQANIKSIPAMVIITSLTGWYKGWWQQSWQYIKEWNFLLPLSTLSILSFHRSAAETKIISYIKLLAKALLFVIIIIPFWPRYLLLIFPLGLILLVQQIGHLKKINAVLIVLSLGQLIFFLRPQPLASISFAQTDWQQGNYQEFYSYLAPTNSPTLSRFEYLQHLKAVDHQLKAVEREISLDVPRVQLWQNEITATAHLKIKTSYGDIKYSQPIKLQRWQNKWYFEWQWQLVLPEYQPQASIDVKFEPQTQGALKTSDSATISDFQDWPFLIVKPQLVTDNIAFTGLLGNLFDKNAAEFENQLFVDNQSLTEVEIGFVPPDYSPTQLEEVKQHPAVSVEMRPTRVYHPVLKVHQEASQTKLLTQAQDLEKNHPELVGQPGVTITLRIADAAEKVVYSQPKIDGQDVTLSQTPLEIFGVDLTTFNQSQLENK